MDDLQAEEVLRQLREQTPPRAGRGSSSATRRCSSMSSGVRARRRRRIGLLPVRLRAAQSPTDSARLLRFRTGGPARFSTWLCAVARNLCLDWHRRECRAVTGSSNPSRGCPPLDQQIFHGLFVDRASRRICWRHLHAAGVPATHARGGRPRARSACSARSRPRQRWLLTVRRAARRARAGPPRREPAEHAPWESRRAARLPRHGLALREERALLLGRPGRLPARERLLMRLRFERGLTLDEIARLLRPRQPAERRPPNPGGARDSCAPTSPGVRRGVRRDSWTPRSGKPRSASV